MKVIEQNKVGRVSLYTKKIGVRVVDANCIDLHLTEAAPSGERRAGGSFEPRVIAELRDALTEALVEIGYEGKVVKATPARKSPKGAQRYLGNGKHEWGRVTEGGWTSRLRVPGGWLYRTTTMGNGVSTVFVPVPEVVGYEV